MPVTLDFSKAQPLSGSGVTLDFSKAQPLQGKPIPVVEGSLSANKKPAGWFDQAEQDLRQGGNRTIVGRTLGHMQGQGDKGYTGMESGTSKGVVDIAGSPELGALHIAKGATQLYGPDNHPLRGAGNIVKGTLEASTLPSMLAVPGGAEGAVEALPSAKHAGAILNEIEHAASGVPVMLNNSGKALGRAQELMDAGHGNVPALKKLIARYTDPAKPPLTYSDARDFSSAISKLTSKEKASVSGQLAAQVNKVAAGLKQDIAAAADEVGESARYYASVKEYARAKRLASVAKAMQKTLVKYGWKGALGAAGAGAGGAAAYEMGKSALKPANSVMPDTGDATSKMPDFIQKVLENANITKGKPTSTYGGMKDIATVEEGDPKNIVVRDPSRMQPQVMAHEATHLWQSNLAPSVRSAMPQDDPKQPYLSVDDIAKLPEVRAKGVTAQHMTPEHQAQIVQAYVQYYHDPQMRKILQPWIDEMQKMQQSNVLPTGPEDKTINTTPRAPGVPAGIIQ